MRIVHAFQVDMAPGSRKKQGQRKQSSSGGDKIVPKVPRGLRVLPNQAPGGRSGGSEYDALKAEAARIEAWWATPRWQDTKRVYSGTFWFSFKTKRMLRKNTKC